MEACVKCQVPDCLASLGLEMSEAYDLDESHLFQPENKIPLRGRRGC